MDPASSPPTDGDRRRREDRALFLRWQRDGDAQARDEIVERFLPLARQIASRYRRTSEPLDDLFQVASLGLIKAIDRFDPDRGVVFATYAGPTILGEVKRHFRDRTWSIRVPRELQELTLRVDKAVGELAERLRRQPSVAEVGQEVGATAERVLEAMEASGAHRAVSLAAPAGGEGEPRALGDAIGVDERGFAQVEDRATIDGLLSALTEQERLVLALRFEQDMTQAEIGVAVGVSQMQVSRILRQAVGRLRSAADAGPT